MKHERIISAAIIALGLIVSSVILTQSNDFNSCVNKQAKVLAEWGSDKAYQNSVLGCAKRR